MSDERRTAVRGFTLVEMLIALVVVAVATAAVFRVFTTSSRSYERGTRSIDGQQNARAAVNWMARELRAARQFNLALPGEVTILSDANVPNQQRTLRLDRNDRDRDGDTSELLLVRNPADDGTPGVFVDEIAVGLDSLRFVYRDAAGAPTGTRTAIREVEIEVFAAGSALRDVRGAGAAGSREVGMSTRVKCRNLGRSAPGGGDVTPPGAPTGISVTMGCGTATVQWAANPETDLAGYYLSYASGGGGAPYAGTGAHQGPSPLFVGGAASYTLTGLDPTSTYYFSVQAVDASDNVSGYGPETSGVPADATAPPAPGSVAGRLVGADLVLSWTPVPDWDLEWYRVTWSEDTAPGIVHVDSTQTPAITLGGLTPGATVTCRVTAVDACGNAGPASSPVSVAVVSCVNDAVPPSPPTGVSAVAGDGFVQLAWTLSPEPDVAGYEVTFRESGASPLTVPVGSGSQYTLSGLSNGVAYSFELAAVDGCGNVSGRSASLSATPQSCLGNLAPPSVPAGVTAKDAGIGDRIDLSWTASAQGDVLGYVVHWGTSPTPSASADVGNVIFHSVSGLQSGQTYYFSVHAYDVCGNPSAGSAPVAAVPTWGCACAPAAAVVTPAAGATVAGVTPWLAAATACSTAALASVEFRIDGATRYVDYGAPFEFGDYGAGWDTYSDADGQHRLVVLATDTNGCRSADSVTVFVDNAGLGASCLDLAPGAVAAVQGVYDEQWSIGVTNLSAVDTYDLARIVLTWSDPQLVVTAVRFDGTTVWQGGTAAASGVPLDLSPSPSVLPGTTALMEVHAWDAAGTSPPAIDVAGTDFDVLFEGSPGATCGPYPVPMGACLPDVQIQNVAGSLVYDVWGQPSVGDPYYTDRTYTLTYLPPELQSSILVRSPNDDKNQGGGPRLVLSFDRDVTIWVAYDPRGTPPIWITNNYSNTGLTIGVSDPGTPTLNLWSLDAPASAGGSFQGNKSQGWNGNVATNYTVFITCQ